MTTCPEEIRAENRRAALEMIWNSPEWDFLKKLFLSRHPVCQMCGKPAQVPHHPHEADYGKPEYLKKLLEKCVPLCNKCHWAIRRGLRPCPVCREHYIPPSREMCRHCDPNAAKEAEDREIRKIRVRKAQRELRRKQYQEWKKRCKKN